MKQSKSVVSIIRQALLAGLTAICVNASFAAEAPRVSGAQTAQAAGMVDIQSLVSDMRLEMRYASSNNFVGERVRGYEAARCYLLKPVAEALQRVERSLRDQSMRLKIFDCYRPVRAVQHFVEWAGDLHDQETKSRYYPNLEKGELLEGYIASTSGHSRGATVVVAPFALLWGSGLPERWRLWSAVEGVAIVAALTMVITGASQNLLVWIIIIPRTACQNIQSRKLPS